MFYKKWFRMVIVLVGSMLVFVASTVTAQATHPISLSIIQSLGNAHVALPAGAPASHKVNLPLVIRSAGGAASATPTRTPTRTNTSSTPTRTATHTPTKTATLVTPPGTQGALFMNTANETNGAKVAVDASGGIHMTYIANSADAFGKYPLYYGYCATNCSSKPSWNIVSFGDDVSYVELALTKTGHPRLLILGDDASFHKHYWYAACDSGCSTNVANWTTHLVVDTDYTDLGLWDYSYYTFALDPQDHPRFIYQKHDLSGTAWYVFCDGADCSAPLASWFEVQLSISTDTDIFFRPSLTFTSTGFPRLATEVFSSDTAISGILFYAGCDTTCGNAANWWYTPLYNNVDSYVLRLTTTDQPRIAFYQGATLTGTLYYLSCSTNCANGANWGGINFGLGAGNGQVPDLALDAQNRPRIVYHEDTPNGLGYAWCTANCELITGTWQIAHVESSAVLQAEWPMLPPAPCSLAYWYAGYRPSIALDGSGNPRIGSQGVHLHGGGCTVGEDFRAVRSGLYNQP